MINAVALQGCPQFVGRTTNWLYDHLRFVPRYAPVVFCNKLVNRDEFPDLGARSRKNQSLTRRVWRRFAGERCYPNDLRWLRKLAPCVLHSHFGPMALQDFILYKTLQVPWVMSFYGADAYQVGCRAEWQQRYAAIFDKVTRVLALGPVMAEHLEKLGCPGEKIVIHPLGVDVESLPCRPRVLQHGESLRLLFAGTFREKKGISYVIEAAAIVQKAGLQLEIHLVGDAMGKSGDQETKETVLRQISRLGLDDIIIHHSFLKFSDLIDLALRSHVFMAPSVTAADGDAEGTPFVLQQMMATGMPAIATMHSDIPSLFGDQRLLLVPERDSSAIADRLERYIHEPDTLIADGMALRDQIRHAFDVRKCAARLGDLYDAVR